MSRPLSESDIEIIMSRVNLRLQAPLDPFTGKTLASVLMLVNDPWIVGGTVWRAMDPMRRQMTDVDLLLATKEDVDLFLSLWVLPTTTTYRGGKRLQIPGHFQIDVWAPNPGESRETHVKSFPKDHQRMAVSAKEGPKDWRVSTACGCPDCQPVYASAATIPTAWVSTNAATINNSFGRIISYRR